MVEGGQVISYEKFLVCIGIRFMMVTIEGFQQHDFWINSKTDPFETAPYCFNNILPSNRFEEIITALTITEKTPQEYNNNFWEVTQMIDAWNHNMEIMFSPSYISCLDEPMMKWVKNTPARV